MATKTLRARMAFATQLAILGIVSPLLVSGCGGGTSAASHATPSSSAPSSNAPLNPAPSNPVPTINSVDTTCALVGAQAFTLGVWGSNFVRSSVVRWNGSDRPTTSSISGQLNAQISTSDIAAAGTAAITVFNPAPGGGSSNSLTFTTTTGGVDPQSIAVDPSGRFAYVANTGCLDGHVSMYTINPTTGELTSIGPPVDSQDEGARSVTVDPFGKFAFVVNWGEGDTAGSVSAYTINATTGALTSTGTIYGEIINGTQILCAPWSVFVDPSGKFAYVTNEGCAVPPGISMFTINATTGALTFIGTIDDAGGRAISLAVDPMGKFVYVANNQDDNVSMYTINTTTGALTSTGLIAAGTGPSSVTVDPTGRFVYVANSGSNNVSMYTINATTGILTSIGLIAAGVHPAAVAVGPAGEFAYVANLGSNDVSMYTINSTSGALASTGLIAAGTGPSSVVVDPTGKYAYVTNGGSNDVSMYNINATTGALTLMGTIGT